MKIVTVVGARPQFIKASVVSATLAAQAHITEVMVHTGQHFDVDMSGVFFRELGIRSPDYNLGIHGGNHGEMTGQMLVAIERVLLKENPQAVLVYGDTNSTLAGALGAVKLHIPVAHVEAGLRSFNMRMPEEVNRVLADRISKWLFVPTDEAVRNLMREGADPVNIEQVGDVMYDVALRYGAIAARRTNGALQKLGLGSQRFVLATVHRAENTDDPIRLSVIAKALIEVAAHLPVVWPLHPRTRAALLRDGILSELERMVQVVEPLGYLDLLQLERAAAVIATDSGGVQKEAFFHRVPCVTLRDETEWVELVAAGWNVLVTPINVGAIRDAIEGSIGRQGSGIVPYGCGDAAERIVQRLMHDMDT